MPEVTAPAAPAASNTSAPQAESVQPKQESAELSAEEQEVESKLD